jgi:hypothetical protein
VPEQYVAAKAVSLADRLLSMIHDIAGDTELAVKYNKPYIGLAKHGIADNFVVMIPERLA